MSHAVLLLVTFPCSNADVVAELARKHAVLLGVDPSQELVRGGLDSGVWEAVEFLVDTWRFPHLDAKASRCPTSRDQHVLVFMQPEQTQRAKVFDVYCAEDGQGPLQVEQKTLPVGWGV